MNQKPLFRSLSLLLVVIGAAAPGLGLCADWEPILSSSPKDKDRFTSFHAHAAKGPHMQIAVSTFFGGADHEVFRAVGELPDGRIVAFGNAWGPGFPAAPAASVIGRGKHLGLNPLKQSGKRAEISDEDPDCAAFLVLYTPGLAGIEGVTRFDWGLASLSTGKVTADGEGFLLAGRCTPAFRGLEVRAGGVAKGAGEGKGYEYQGVSCSGDVYVLRMGLDGTIQWRWILEGVGTPPSELWEDAGGAVYFDAGALGRIAADGKDYQKIVDRSGGSASGWLFVDAEGNGYFGGDRNTHTNMEPWRQPYLYKYNPAGEKMWTLWETNPKEVGADAGGLQSDSAVRDLAFMPDGRMITAGWSDGANTVFQRHATDWKRNCPQFGFMDPWWPNGAQGFGHLNLIDPASLATLGHLWWVSYLPADFGKKMNRTNAARFERILPLANGALAWTGSSATGTIQTPNAFYQYPGKGKASGATMGVFPADFSNLLFSSYLPGCSDLALGAAKNGVLVVGGVKALESKETPLESYSVHPLQKFGGATDGLIFQLVGP